MSQPVRLPDYQRMLAHSARAHSATDDDGLIDEDPKPETRGGLTSHHRRRARENLAQVIRRMAPPEEMVGSILAIIRDGGVAPETRIAAVKTLWNYGYGRPAQLHQVEAIAGSSGTDSFNEVSERVIATMEDAELVEVVRLADEIKRRIL